MPDMTLTVLMELVLWKIKVNLSGQKVNMEEVLSLHSLGNKEY